MQSALLLIVDVQQSLVAADPEGREQLLKTIGGLQNRFRACGAKVAFVRHDDGPDSAELAFGTPGWEIAEEIAPQPGEKIFEKRFNSAFLKTGLENYLREKGVDTLVIAGMQTEYCIDATVKSAFERGFQVLVPEDGVSTFDNGPFTADQINCFFLGNIWNGRYAKVLSAEEIKKEVL